MQHFQLSSENVGHFVQAPICQIKIVLDSKADKPCLIFVDMGTPTRIEQRNTTINGHDCRSTSEVNLKMCVNLVGNKPQ